MLSRALTAAFLLLGASQTAQAQSPTQRAQAEAKQFLTTCPRDKGDARGLCIFHQDEFVRNYVSAKSGNWDDQHNVAAMLRNGADGAVTVNLVQACAWQLVRTKHGNARQTGSDLVVAGEVCNQLPTQADHLAAATRAARIADDIRRSPARPLPSPKEKPFKGPLDDTACPLPGGPDAGKFPGCP